MYFIPLSVLLLYLIYIEVTNRRYRRSFDMVIHVNGIRGKSTIVRMLDAVFREHGYSTFSKVTGTYPKTIDCYGIESDIKRNTPTINEQRKIMKKAYKQGAKVLIIECMALRKESQIQSYRLLKSDISIISNVRTDHLEIMGLNHDDILKHLALSTGDELILTSDAFVYKHLVAMKKNAQFVSGSIFIEGEYQDNTALVEKIACDLGIQTGAIIKGLKTYKKDRCNQKVLSWQHKKIYNAFSANDYESTLQLFRDYLSVKELDEVDKTLLMWFNDRYDRPIRSRLFLKWLIKVEPVGILLTGENRAFNRKKLIKMGYCGSFITEEDLRPDHLIFGFGNIKGLPFYEE